MRTTIEITAEQRSKLMALAALNNEKGFSKLVREAIDDYLDSRLGTSQKITSAIQLRGSLGEKDTDVLAIACDELRENWR